MRRIVGLSLYWVATCSAIILLSSCAPLVAPEIVDTFVFDAPFDTVWGATVATIADKSLPIEAIEKESGIITTKQVTFASGFLADREIERVAIRPSIFLGTWSNGRYSLSIYVNQISESQTKMTITSHIEALENNMTKSWHVCYSKGIIEVDVWESIRGKVR